MIVVTGASGQLGRLVIANLLKRVPATEIVAMVRSPEAASDLAVQGVTVRRGDYTDPSSLDAAFSGVEKLLLISSSEVGQRLPQHRNAIEAAKRAGAKLIVYTSVLRAETSPLGLAAEHRATEALLADSGVPYVVLRNGWYTENYLASVPAALQNMALYGAAGEGRIASAPRADYAEAAAVVLTMASHAERVYELAGDDSYTLAEFAAEISQASGKTIRYTNLPEAEFRAALEGAGLPQPLAALLADSDAGAAKGALFEDGRALSRLIGRPTEPMAKLVGKAVR